MVHVTKSVKYSLNYFANHILTRPYVIPDIFSSCYIAGFSAHVVAMNVLAAVDSKVLEDLGHEIAFVSPGGKGLTSVTP